MIRAGWGQAASGAGHGRRQVIGEKLQLEQHIQLAYLDPPGYLKAAGGKVEDGPDSARNEGAGTVLSS